MLQGLMIITLTSILLHSVGCDFGRESATNNVSLPSREKTVIADYAEEINEFALPQQHNYAVNAQPIFTHYKAYPYKRDFPAKFSLQIPDDAAFLKIHFWLRSREDAASRCSVVINCQDPSSTKTLFSEDFFVNENSKLHDGHDIKLPMEEYKGQTIQISVEFNIKEFSGTEPTLHLTKPVLYSRRVTSLPNIVLLCIDTWRWDYLDDNYDRGLTPNISQLIKDSILFKEAYSSSPWTVPAVASVLTGRPPSEHGAGGRIYLDDINIVSEGKTIEELQKEVGRPVIRNKLTDKLYTLLTLPAEAETLPEVIDPTYTTRAWTANNYLHTLRALKGFQTYSIVHWVPNYQLDAEFSGWLDQNRDALFFLYLHLIEPHQWGQVGNALYKNANWESADEKKAKYASIYDDLVKMADMQIGRIINSLKIRGLYDDTLIVLYSDHGEHLYDGAKGEYTGHGNTLFDTLIKVPLVVKLPENKYAGEIINARVQTLDAFYLMKSMANDDQQVDMPRYARSLLGMLNSDSEKDDRLIICEYLMYGTDKIAFKSGDYKAIYDLDSSELFFISSQQEKSFELLDIEPAESNIKAKMLSSLVKYARSQKRGNEFTYSPTAMTEEDIKALKDLGYIQ